MKILHIVSAISKSSGGPARSVQGLVAAQCAVGIDAWLMTLMDRGDPWVDGILNYRCAKCSGAHGVRDAVERVIDECHPDLIEVHSLWQLNLHAAVRAAQLRNIPYILTPRGCLDIWSLRQKWLKKKIALATYQGRDLKRALAFHTTSDEESLQIRKLGYKQPIIQAPNGVNTPNELPTMRLYRQVRRMLFLSRMHRKKGVLDLVEAWARVKELARTRHWCCELVYTTRNEDELQYERQVKERISSHGMTYVVPGSADGDLDEIRADFILTGAMDDADKWIAYSRADCFVLPTHTENFGIVIAEALYAGVPVITTTGAPWKVLQDEACGWWVPEGDVVALSDAILEVIEMDGRQLCLMGARGQELIKKRYSWEGIAKTMKSAYEDLVSKLRSNKQ